MGLFGTSEFTFFSGGGAALDLGAVIRDREFVALSGRVATIGAVTEYAIGVSYAHVFSDNFAIGTSPSIAVLAGVFGWPLGGNPGTAVAVPLQLHFDTSARSENEIAQNSFRFSVEVVPTMPLSGPKGPGIYLGLVFAYARH